MTFTCGTCCRKFPAGRHSQEQHLAATGHSAPEFECNACGRYFGSQQALNQPIDAFGHSADHKCDDCSDIFSDEEELRDHEVSEDYYCGPCECYFNNWHAINNHRNSSRHTSGKVACPFCGEGYAAASGATHHIERGCCPNAPIDRMELYQAVRDRDPTGVLSKKFLTGPYRASQTKSYQSTKKSWNPKAGAFECYLCHRQFETQRPLDQHLNSPAHQQSLYHCPNRKCCKDFGTLAAVMNHLESESCSFIRFKAVQQKFNNVLQPGRMITF